MYVHAHTQSMWKKLHSCLSTMYNDQLAVVACEKQILLLSCHSY